MKKNRKSIIRSVGVVLYIVYILLLLYFLFFSEKYGRVPQEEREYRYNLVPFMEIRRFWIYRDKVGTTAFLTNIFGNVLAFIPFGFILPIISEKMRNGFLICISGLELSLTVECIQLITRVGCFDVDDLILNTLGAALGYLLLVICNHPRRKKYHGKKI
ncbi:MAG: VanZ family protein [Blautia sp.]|nr:VanZ family protein [Blautia sp.]MDD7729389.1 VanZ family protein [Clostridia bacterium]MDY5665173.1 VanZ family protein [Blautia sp.]